MDYKKMSEEELIGELETLQERLQYIDELERNLHELEVYKVELEMQNRELREMQRELESSRNSYSELYDFAPVGYFTHDRGSIIKEINLTGAEMLGTERANLIGMPFRSYVEKGDLEKFYNHLVDCEKTERIVTDLRLKVPGNKDFYVRLQTVPVRNEKKLYRTAIIDITEAKKAEEERTRLEKELYYSNKMESLGVMAGGIAHDFNNILGGIMGLTEISLEELPEESLVKENLRSVMKSCNRAKNLIKQIMDFSKHDMNNRRALKITSIVEEALVLLRATVPSNIQIIRDFNVKNDVIIANSEKFYQVILNICTNSLQAMDGSGILKIEINEISPEDSVLYSLKPGNYTRLTVRDTGPGIEEDIKEKIFDPYFTTKEMGSGMGLSISYGIIKKLGGTITLESEIGKGAAFHIFLPLSREEVLEELERPERVPFGSEGILFVDDEEMLVSCVETFLSGLGYRVFVTVKSSEALEVFRKDPEKFDLIITDQTMPNMKGSELIKEIFSLRPHIPVIICSGYTEDINYEKAIALGCREFLVKPLRMKELSRVIRKVLDREAGKGDQGIWNGDQGLDGLSFIG